MALWLMAMRQGVKRQCRVKAPAAADSDLLTPAAAD